MMTILFCSLLVFTCNTGGAFLTCDLNFLFFLIQNHYCNQMTSLYTSHYFQFCLKWFLLLFSSWGFISSCYHFQYCGNDGVIIINIRYLKTKLKHGSQAAEYSNKSSPRLNWLLRQSAGICLSVGELNSADLGAQVGLHLCLLKNWKFSSDS